MAASVFAVATASCGTSALPRPPYTAHASVDLVAVPYSPPPARIEVIPDTPDSRAVWLDGEWTWTGRRWSWRRGRWVIPPQGAAFAPWQVVRDPKGSLYLAQGSWRATAKPDAGVIEDPVAVGEAKGSRLPVVNLDGEDEPTGADVRSERAAPGDAGTDAGSKP